MLKQTKRISFRISSILSKVEPEPDLHTGSDQKVPAPTGSGSATLALTNRTIFNHDDFRGLYFSGGTVPVYVCTLNTRPLYVLRPAVLPIRIESDPYRKKEHFAFSNQDHGTGI